MSFDGRDSARRLLEVRLICLPNAADANRTVIAMANLAVLDDILGALIVAKFNDLVEQLVLQW